MARLEIRIFKKEKNGSLRRQIELLEAEIGGQPVPVREDAGRYAYVFEGEPGIHVIRLREPSLAGSVLPSLLLCLMVFTDGIHSLSPFTCRYTGELHLTEDTVLSAMLEEVLDAKGRPTGFNRLDVRAENADLRTVEQDCTASKAEIRRWFAAVLLPPEILGAAIMMIGFLAGFSAMDATGVAGACICWLFAFLCLLVLLWYPFFLIKKCRRPGDGGSGPSI